MRWVVDLAADMDVEVIAVHAFDLLAFVGAHGMFALVDDRSLLDAAREELETRWVASLRNAGVKYRTEIVEGNPAQALLATAKNADADMIVVGARGRGGFREILLGSVSHHVSHHAETPVVIVHSPKAG